MNKDYTSEFKHLRDINREQQTTRPFPGADAHPDKHGGELCLEGGHLTVAEVLYELADKGHAESINKCLRGLADWLKTQTWVDRRELEMGKILDRDAVSKQLDVIGSTRVDSDARHRAVLAVLAHDEALREVLFNSWRARGFRVELIDGEFHVDRPDGRQVEGKICQNVADVEACIVVWNYGDTAVIARLTRGLVMCVERCAGGTPFAAGMIAKHLLAGNEWDGTAVAQGITESDKEKPLPVAVQPK
jgi:hypothetical protein